MFDFVHHIAYVVRDMDDAVRVFGETFELKLCERRIIEGETSVEMAAFRCGQTLIEVLRPINHPELEQFLKEHGPGLHHVGFAMKGIDQGVKDLQTKGITINGPFIAGTGWKIAYFDFEKSDLNILKSCYHGDHLAEADVNQ